MGRLVTSPNSNSFVLLYLYQCSNLNVGAHIFRFDDIASLSEDRHAVLGIHEIHAKLTTVDPYVG